MRRTIIVLGMLLTAQAARGVAADRTFPITPAEARCSEMQLARVQRRMTSLATGQIPGSLGTNAIWNTSARGGAFAGLVRYRDLGAFPFDDFLSGIEHFAEADLAFDLLFKGKVSVLDPHTPPVPQATLVRRDPGTSLVVDHAVTNSGIEGSCCISADATCDFQLSCPMILNFDLAAVPGDSVNPLVPLVINSAAAATPTFPGPLASFLPAASGTGPGIANDALDQACGGMPTDFDTHVFEIIARTLAPSSCYLSEFGGAGCGLSGYNLALFRGADPHLYRADLYAVQYLCGDSGSCYSITGPLALEFHVNWDGHGRLTTGDVRVLPECRPGESSDCSAPFVQNSVGIFVLPPIFPGFEVEEPAAFHGAPFLSVTPDRAHQVLEATINWTALLSKTDLNRP